jgi:hypothetical protein
VASKKTLNAKNLEVLGAERLAELLIEISTGDAAAKRRLRLELAVTESPAEVAREVRKRLTTIARSRSFVDWQNRRALVDDLEAQRSAIVNQLAKADPVEGLDLMWRFLALATPIFERCDDSSGTVIGIFHAAGSDLGEIAKAAKIDPEKLANQAFQAMMDNDYGQYDDLISALTPALGQEGLEHLKRRMIALSNEPVERPADQERRVIGFGSGGPVYADDMAEHSRVSTVRLALMEIADALGDVDAFIGQYDEQTRKVPKFAAQIAQRLLAAGRAQEAWQTIEETQPRRDGWDWPDFEWEMHGSMCSMLSAAATKPRPHAGRASSDLCRPRICAPTSSDFPTSTISQPRIGPLTMRRASRTCFRRCHSWYPGPPWTERRSS